MTCPPHLARAKLNNTSSISRHGFLHAGARRRVWDCTPLGFELPIFWLHVETLAGVVDHFLAAESTTTHTTDRRKPLLLTEAISGGRIPPRISHVNITAVVVDFDVERQRFCRGLQGGNIVKCMENLQRFKLVEKLIDMAATDDLALFGDVDEIARPSVVSMLSQCNPFAGLHAPPYYILTLTLFKYGVHCDHGNAFNLGTRLFGMRHLQLEYGHYRAANPAVLATMSASFTATRLATRQPIIREAGWHLTSFGEPWELKRKLNTWLHANMFKGWQIDVDQLERCMRFCLDLLDRSKRHPALCASRDDPQSVRLPGRVVERIEQADLPPPLVAYTSDYPASWMRYLRSHGAATGRLTGRGSPSTTHDTSWLRRAVFPVA